MGSRQFTQQQKLSVLKAAEDVGVKESARVAGVHHVTVYEWRRQLESLGEEAFLAKDVHRPGRGVKEVSQEQELVHGCSLEDADRRR